MTTCVTPSRVLFAASCMATLAATSAVRASIHSRLRYRITLDSLPAARALIS